MFKLKKNKNKHQDAKAASENLIISEQQQQQNNEIPAVDKQKANLEANNEADNKKPVKKGELRILLFRDGLRFLFSWIN